MIENLISILTTFIINTISTLGYPGVALLMAVQTAAIPIPSEIILPFAGSLVSSGRFGFFSLALVGAAGSSLGALGAYLIGAAGGRPLAVKYGRKVFVSARDLKMAENFLSRHGALAVFAGMMLPVLRSIISFPAGVLKMPLKKFLPLVFFGSFFWSLFLVFLGMKLGENWVVLREKFHGFDTAIIILILIGGVWWVWRHFKHARES